MKAALASTADRLVPGPGGVRSAALGNANIAGILILGAPMLLGMYLASGSAVWEAGMYGLCVVAVLPHLGPFADSLGWHPANLLFVLLFVALATSTFAAFGRAPSADVVLQVKGLAATAVWTSVYIVTFSSLRTIDAVRRLTRWISKTCVIVSASVYLSALLHTQGIGFGEVIEFSDGSFRAFGPLGDQVGFVLVFPILISLVAARPFTFAVHLGALLLTATRGAVLCLLVGVLMFLLMAAAGSFRANARRLRWSLVAIAAGGLVWLSPFSAVLNSRLSDPSVLRLQAMRMGIEVFRENPLLGTGFNGFANARPAVAEDWLIPEQAENGLSRATNQYIQTATDGGAIALACLLLFVACTGRNALRVIRWRSATSELVALQLWLISVLAGNHGSLWLLSNTGSGFFIFAAAGLTARASALAAEQPRLHPGALPRSGSAARHDDPHYAGAF